MSNIAETPWEHGGDYEGAKGMAVPLAIGGLAQFIVSFGGRHSAPVGPALPGYVIGSTLVVGLILYFVFARSRDPRGWWKIPLVLLPVAAFATSISTLDSAAEQRKAADRIAAVGERMVASDGLDAGPSGHSGAQGEAGEMERIFVGWMQRLSADRRNYEREFDALDLEGLIVPERLSSASAIRDARERIRRGRAIVERYRALHAQRLAELPQLLDRAEISETTRRNAIAGMRSTGGSDQSSRLWEIELESIDGAAALLDIVARTRWRPHRGGFGFERQADATAFNAQLGRLSALALEQQRLKGRHQRRARGDLEDLRRSGRL